MDDSQGGLLLIGTTMIILIAFLLTVLAVMIIYRKRKLQHDREISEMNEHFEKELLQTQIEVQQQTMKYIGREIHDNVGQKLTLAVLYVQQLETNDPEGHEQTESIASIIHESLSDLRSLSKNLTNTDHLQDDLQTLIDRECMKIQATGLCKACLHSNTRAASASIAVKSFVLRIVQEFLQNSLKHSGCSLIALQLRENGTGLEICAEDNGRGFDLEDIPGHKGIGLDNMRRRAEIIQADLTLESKPREGTRMKLFIPSRQLNV